MLKLVLIELVIVLIAYIIGNVSPATLIASAEGIDIKELGSGNPGTTNVLRTLGPKAAIVTLVIDVGKGYIATRLGYDLMIFVINAFAVSQGVIYIEHIYLISAWCALAVVVGHCWPAVLKFKGGKGVATAFGAILASNWKLAFFCILIFIMVVAISRFVSLGSIMAALSYVVLYMKDAVELAKSIEVEGANYDYYLQASVRFWIRTVPYIIIVIIIVARHKENIKRLFRGEESRLNIKIDF